MELNSETSHISDQHSEENSSAEAINIKDFDENNEPVSTPKNSNGQGLNTNLQNKGSLCFGDILAF